MRARKRLASLGYGTSTFRVAFACGNGNAQIKRTAGEGNRVVRQIGCDSCLNRVILRPEFESGDSFHGAHFVIIRMEQVAESAIIAVP
jgi:hypothetical protein